jgi:hypothetical protein
MKKKKSLLLCKPQASQKPSADPSPANATEAARWVALGDVALGNLSNSLKPMDNDESRSERKKAV